MVELETTLLFLSTAVLGVFLGAQIAEACLFVPIWKQMNPDDFFEQHKTVGPMIYRFFAPLTITSTFLPLITVFVHLIWNPNQNILFWVMGISTSAFFATYFLYFKNANQKFADRALANDQLPLELQRWGNWHWTRIGFEAIAFTSSIIILLMK
ncbi:MAG: hypothetical protein AAF708_03455 [Deinococcota bacterium]